VRNAAPLRVLSEQRSERLWVTPVERFSRCSELVDDLSRELAHRQKNRLIGASELVARHREPLVRA
jgi:hypothetical protein